MDGLYETVVSFLGVSLALRQESGEICLFRPPISLLALLRGPPSYFCVQLHVFMWPTVRALRNL